MKRPVSLLCALLLLLLCACGSTPAAPSAPPEPEVVIPDPPGTGRILVHMRRDAGIYADESGETELIYSCYVPEITVGLREEAARLINRQLEQDRLDYMDTLSALVLGGIGGEARRTCQVPREDRNAVSLLFTCESPEGSRRYARCYSALTGERLRLEDVATDMTGLSALCGEYLAAMTGRNEVSPVEFSDGAWYLSDQGLVGITDSGDFTYPYAVLFPVLAEGLMPPETDTVSGALRAAYTNNVERTLDYLDELTVAEGYEGVALWAEGTLRDVRAIRVEGESFAETELVWSCSRLEDGEAVRFNITLPQGVPDLKLTWTTDQGYYEALLSRNGQTGEAGLLLIVGTEEISSPAAGSPYSYITAQELLGHWTNGETGIRAVELSLQKNLCYVWHGDRELEGACFRWSLEWPGEAELPPELVIYTGGETGNLVYTLEELSEGVLVCGGGETRFVRSEASG